MATANLQTGSDFGAPFDCADGDVYLRSADGVHFRVHKAILSVASVTFRELFASGSGSADAQRNGLPVVPLLAADEGKATVEAFLRMIYPVGFPSLDDITLIRRVLEFVRKYQADVVRANLAEILLRHSQMKDVPLSFYAIACVHRMEEVARVSALECVTQGLDGIVKREDQRDEFLVLNNVDIHRLHAYRDRCSIAINDASSFESIWLHCVHTDLDGRDHLGLGVPVFLQEHNSKTSPAGACSLHEWNRSQPWEETQASLSQGYYPREWWTTYLDDCRNALKDCPRPALVNSYELTWKALLSAGMCDLCRAHATRDLHSFVIDFEEHLWRALNKIRLEF